MGSQYYVSLADPGGAAGMPPQQDPIHFHICFCRRAPMSEVGAPSNGSASLAMGNPGSTTVYACAGGGYGTDFLFEVYPFTYTVVLYNCVIQIIHVYYLL